MAPELSIIAPQSSPCSSYSPSSESAHEMGFPDLTEDDLSAIAEASVVSESPMVSGSKRDFPVSPGEFSEIPLYHTDFSRIQRLPGFVRINPDSYVPSLDSLNLSTAAPHGQRCSLPKMGVSGVARTHSVVSALSNWSENPYENLSCSGSRVDADLANSRNYVLPTPWVKNVFPAARSPGSGSESDVRLPKRRAPVPDCSVCTEV